MEFQRYGTSNTTMQLKYTLEQSLISTRTCHVCVIFPLNTTTYSGISLVCCGLNFQWLLGWLTPSIMELDAMLPTLVESEEDLIQILMVFCAFFAFVLIDNEALLTNANDVMVAGTHLRIKFACHKLPVQRFLQKSY